MRCGAIISLLMLAFVAKAQTVVFDSLALHLPTMVEGDTTAHCLTFRFTNTGNEPLTIGKVWPTCGCTKVAYSPATPIASGKSDSIVVQYKSDRNPGTIDEPIFVYSDRDDLNHIAKLHVLGNIVESPDSRWRHLPATMGPLRLKRKELTFNEDDKVMRIVCANTGPAPLRLKALMLPQYATLRTEPEVIKPGEEADIVVSIDRSKMPAMRPLRSSVIIDGLPCDIKSRTITLYIK